MARARKADGPPFIVQSPGMWGSSKVVLIKENWRDKHTLSSLVHFLSQFGPDCRFVIRENRSVYYRVEIHIWEPLPKPAGKKPKTSK